MKRTLSNRNRSCYWDVVKGISIVAVILIHTTGVGTLAGATFRQFINFPVALFFFVAGIFCHFDGNWKDYLTRKGKRLLCPFAVFTIIYACEYLYFSFGHGASYDLFLLMNAVLSFPLGWGYFVLALFQAYCLCPFLMRASFRMRLGISVFGYVIAIAYYFVGCFVLPEFDLCRRMMPYVFCLPWLPVFVIGLSIEGWRFDGNRIIKPSLILCAVCLLISILESFLATSLLGSWEWAFAQIKPSSMAMSIMLAVVLFFGWKRTESGVQGRCFLIVALSLMGRYSFFVYLSHRLVLQVLRSLSGSLCMADALFFYCLPIAAIVAEFIMVVVLDRLPGSVKRFSWLIGG